MKHLTIMLKPASSLCNLRCKYCFYADITSLREVSSFGVMKESAMTAVMDHIFIDLDDGDYLTLSFQGGEPMLAGLPFYRNLVQYIAGKKRNIHINYTLQTNGILLDDDWCKFLAKYGFLIGISLDILPESHDAVRVDTAGQGTYEQVLRSISLLKKYHIEHNVLCTLTRQTARHPAKVWAQIKKLDLSYIQFTPCLGDLNSPGSSAYALTPERFFHFYSDLFDLWYRDFATGNYRSIKLFDDLLQLLAKGLVTSCGISGYCQPQIVVEADGSAYPCDFYCLDQFRLWFLTLCGRSMKSPQCLHVRSEICFRNYVPPVSIENFVAADVNACSGKLHVCLVIHSVVIRRSWTTRSARSCRLLPEYPAKRKDYGK
jgi:uncharacterized protein